MKIMKKNKFVPGRMDAVVLPIFTRADLIRLQERFPEIKPLLARQKRRWNAGDELIIGSAQQRTLLIFVGAGKSDDLNDARKLAKKTMQKLSAAGTRRAGLFVVHEQPLDRSYWLNLVDYLHLNAYGFNRYKKKKQPMPQQLELSAETVIPLRREDLLERETISAQVISARDLVNEPAAHIHPDSLTEVFRSAAHKHGLQLTVWRGPELKKHKMTGLLAVASGSAYEPALLTLTYTPKKYAHTIALVGKGLTFDSGGLNIKTAGAHMEEMKSDMAGAAAVLGAVCASAALKLPVRVLGLAALAENMPGSKAYKPGDILTYANGKTVEVVNTDAEGRLVLADALLAAVRLKPDAVIELSTLTGAIITALGDGYAGLMCNNKRLAAALLKAGETCGELLWELPLFAEFRDSITSRVADLKNANYGGASSIKAGLFLSEFVAKTPFAHLDIAGTAFLQKANHWLAAEGASGFGVRLLLEYLRNLD